jgi:AraC family transcriptional activator of pobA
MYFSVMVPRRARPTSTRRRTRIPAYFLYGEPPRTPDSRTAHVETIAARSAPVNWKIRAHRHRELHQVLFMQRGRVGVSLDAQRLNLRAPAVVVMPPGCVHAFDFQRDSEGLVVTFGADLSRVLARDAQGLARFLDTPAALALDPAVQRETDLEALAALLLREFSRSAPGREPAVTGLLSALLANLQRLAEHLHQGHSAPHSRELELVARFRHALGRQFQNHTGIATYARQLGASETRLRRACLAAAGESPIGLVHRHLLVEAERQLRYTSMSVSQIAWYLGFKDAAYFSRFFTRARGASPRAFRNAQPLA